MNVAKNVLAAETVKVEGVNTPNVINLSHYLITDKRV